MEECSAIDYVGSTSSEAELVVHEESGRLDCSSLHFNAEINTRVLQYY